MEVGGSEISDTETMMYSEDLTESTSDDPVSNGEIGEEGEDGVPLTEGGDDEDSEESEDENESGDKYRIDGAEEIRKVDMIRISEDEFKLYHFISRLVAFEFYNKYALKRGFAARKWNTVVNKEGRVTQQTFVCFREGYRLKKHLKKENRKREARAITRCGCSAFLKVRYARDVSRWIVKAFSDEHSHELLPRKYEGMLTSHRKMNEIDIVQMNTMREVGIGVTQIYGLAANQSGGYKNVGYRKSDMYNEIFKQRRSEGSDAKGALSYLRALGRNDKDLFWSHTVDEEGRLKHLFWSDGRSQCDCKLFGDVLAFDATYRRNKYMLPLVVFAGVNHHNQTIVFGSALVANETEETYVWLLEEFLRAMKGKVPISVITDGDIAMRNAIKHVFPSARHRLCAWHLLRNATSNISNPRFTAKLKKCVLGDYEVRGFRTKWEELISEFGLQSNQWLIDLYGKKKMWATAHIRGSFFGGFRTTSRCEGLHSQVGRYVHYRNNMREFLRHFFQYLAYTRQEELEADFESINGDPVLETPFEDIEACAAKLYSRKVFMKFRVVLWRACKLKVSGCERTPTCHIYIVTNIATCAREWHVPYVAQNEEVKCSCQRMESMGIPCEHIVVLLHYLDIKQLPNSLILERWTKYAKQSVDGADLGSSSTGGSMWKSQVLSLLFDCYEMCRLVGKRMDKLEETRGLIRNHMQSLKDNEEDGNTDEGNDREGDDINLRDPSQVRSKGCGSRQSTGGSRGNRRTTTCSVCQGRGHNKQTCRLRRRQAHTDTNETAASGDEINE